MSRICRNSMQNPTNIEPALGQRLVFSGIDNIMVIKIGLTSCLKSSTISAVAEIVDDLRQLETTTLS